MKKQIMVGIGLTIGVILVTFGVSYIGFINSQSYEYRNAKVIVDDNTVGYILHHDRIKYVDHPNMTIIYRDVLGVWHIQEFPINTVRPFTNQIIPHTKAQPIGN